ncbi:hypothetical protein M3Y96_00552700 [Aphelenchoides besseyi]|nr:hypothetical protein M3Y96_00552700 [Aphelenchoides besseyi]
MYCDLRDLYDPNNSTTSFVPKQLIPYYAQFPNHVEVVGHRLFDDVLLIDQKILIRNASFIGTTFIRKATWSNSFYKVVVGLAPSTRSGYPGLIEQAYNQNLIPQPMISFSIADNTDSLMIMGNYDQKNCELWHFFSSLYDDRWVFRVDSITIGNLNFSGYKNNGYKTYFNSFDINSTIELPNEIVDQMIQNKLINETNSLELTTTSPDLSMNFTINGRSHLFTVMLSVPIRYDAARHWSQ